MTIESGAEAELRGRQSGSIMVASNYQHSAQRAHQTASSSYLRYINSRRARFFPRESEQIAINQNQKVGAIHIIMYCSALLAEVICMPSITFIDASKQIIIS